MQNVFGIACAKDRRMDIGIYNAASTLSSLEKWQDITSQNIAAGSVPGYKGNQMSFEAISAGMMGINSGGQSISAPVSMAMSNTQINFANGQINPTGVPTHAALNGEGFFKIQGEGFEYYTRDGEFHIDSQNQLVNKAGHPVLGENGPITISPQYGEITITETGEVRQGLLEAGKMSIVKIDDNNALVRISGGFRLSQDSQVGVSEVVNPTVRQGNLEESNVSPLKEMVNLISISRAYEVNHKVIQSLDAILGKTIEVMGAT